MLVASAPSSTAPLTAIFSAFPKGELERFYAGGVMQAHAPCPSFS